MKCINTELDEVLLFSPQKFVDERGFFMETLRQNVFNDAFAQRKLTTPQLVQENQSRSVKNVLRGLHFQRQYPQGKLIRVSRGCIFDVAVDLRKGSSTYGKWIGQQLSDENGYQMWIPPGFAHGFYVLSEVADIIYKCSEYYRADDEHTLAWNDPTLNIQWPITADIEPIVSSKDNPKINPNIVTFGT
ncbi:dTDP-4-dehydrorhamnose 3,5-epimerase [Shewanella inventionis]|uniref:dTDP-4-dehydrorhamnose 3,5-epimerase n=1 Tax=Shewanella inventionis TaxID=1738770 RepID=A0ABQ1IR59_9GAMM|nr:dTDP-4-dehydrorhamnose 3,5-epimerase [Shewanella inventionis]MCL1157733.1 dTDP-4-dehydrorhamnose 3,5-epimerase [Shewanella inventionis]UAL42522.1 dTDP-4-dehydrorhamnose 3,5-epimerase [Shewanella inventionis]GGB48042.1 dTDP-4-dehydrorhamnose 3,5-epimerase [Shewanella inventionis]